MKTASLFDFFKVKNTKEIKSFYDPEITERKGVLTEKQIQVRIRYVIENLVSENKQAISVRYPDIYQHMLIPFQSYIPQICEKIKEPVFTEKEIIEEIKKINNSIDFYSLVFYTSIFLIELEKKSKILIYKDKKLSLENILMINSEEEAKLLYKLILKEKPVYIQKTPHTDFTKNLSKTIFPQSNEIPLKTLVSSIYKFVLQLPKYTKKTKSLSKNAKKLLTVLSPQSNPYKAITKILPSAFNLNPENFTQEQYKNFEKILIDTFKELKYKIENLKEAIENEFFKSFGTNDLNKIKERLKRVKDLDSKIFSVYSALEKETWIEIIAIIITDKALVDFEDEDVQIYQKNLKLLISFLEELEKNYIEKLESKDKLPVHISLKTPNENLTMLKEIEKGKEENNIDISIENLSDYQKILLIIKLLKSL